MIRIILISALSLVAVGAILAEDVTAPIPMTVPVSKPFDYTVTVRIRECVDAQSYEITSLSMPVKRTDGVATGEVKSAGLQISVTAKVTGRGGSEVVEITPSLRRDGKVVASPTLLVVKGHVGRFHAGDGNNGITMEVVLNGA
jgi:hypothetical protein